MWLFSVGLVSQFAFRKMDSVDDYYLEPTQKLYDDSVEDDSLEENESTRNDQDVVYGLLTMLDDESNQEFQIFLGENMIGRDRNNCQICIPSASVSLQK